MAIMTYLISLLQAPHVDKKGLQLIRVQLLYNRIKVYVSTGCKVRADQFSLLQISIAIKRLLRERNTIIPFLQHDHSALISQYAFWKMESCIWRSFWL
jgi:hypothetical protein